MQRGQCIMDNLVGKSSLPAGFGELVRQLYRSRHSDTANIESNIIGAIVFYCKEEIPAGPRRDKGKNLFDTVKNVLDEEIAKTDRQIAEENAKLEEMRRHAYRLPDGRMIMRSQKTNNWRFEDGSEVPEPLAKQRVPPPSGG